MKVKTKKRKHIIKTKTKRKRRMSKTTKNRKYGGTILGIGKDGCVIDSLSCGEFTKENGFVAKILNKDVVINIPVNSRLAEIDLENKHFNRYYFPENNCDYDIMNNPEIQTCLQKGMNLNVNNVVFQKFLLPIKNTSNLSKDQYRYLQNSLQLLHDNNITHGDLPDNVMIDPGDEMPRIIDWENAYITNDPTFKEMDRRAFLTHYKTLGRDITYYAF